MLSTNTIMRSSSRSQKPRKISMQLHDKRIQYLAIGALCAFSFSLTYLLSQQGYSSEVTTPNTDTLSGEDYIPIRNDRNPYAPFFIGFDALEDRGVSRDEMRYINDTLTNFTLYNTATYKGKVSYVKDSFTRAKNDNLDSTYTFKFGINNSNIHTMLVIFDLPGNKISISILNGKERVFSKDFSVSSL